MLNKQVATSVIDKNVNVYIFLITQDLWIFTNTPIVRVKEIPTLLVVKRRPNLGGFPVSVLWDQQSIYVSLYLDP